MGFGGFFSVCVCMFPLNSKCLFKIPTWVLYYWLSKLPLVFVSSSCFFVNNFAFLSLVCFPEQLYSFEKKIIIVGSDSGGLIDVSLP